MNEQQLQTPPHFQPIRWKDTRDGDTVYMLGRDAKTKRPAAFGPCTVDRRDFRKLITRDGLRVWEPLETLLVAAPTNAPT